ncbi:MAG: peroxidase-related enzyme [Pseudomonadota bacterium]
MAWITTIHENDAEGELAKTYETVKKRAGSVGNFGRGFSLKPHMYETFIRAYLDACFHKKNVLPPWYQEAVATYVSVLNGCAFCVSHHAAALLTHCPDRNFALGATGALAADKPERFFSGKELAGLRYARQLTLEPASVEEQDIQALRDAGLNDEAILEINLTAGVFAWANRYVSGLGISIEGDDLD